MTTRSETCEEGHLIPGLQELLDSLQIKSYFRLTEEKTLHLLYRAFHQEIDYLKSAYVVAQGEKDVCSTLSPSQILFGQEERYDEVDRTLTGVLALRWIYDNDYEKFKANQPKAVVLDRDSFTALCDYYSQSTKGFGDYETLFMLIVAQVTNDLGKSSDLINAVERRIGTGKLHHNHDVIMSQVLTNSSTRSLIPSFQCLSLDQQKVMEKHIRLSAHFNPGQLVQAESPPAALDILTNPQFSGPELTLKWLEYYLDLAGASGHLNHEGARQFFQPVFRGFWRARQLTTRVAIDETRLSPTDAYDTVLTDRIEWLEKKGWSPAQHFDILENPKDYAKARIFCMARIDNATKATQFNNIYDSLPEKVQANLEKGLRISGKPATSGRFATPAVLPAYMPQMLVNAQAMKEADGKTIVKDTTIAAAVAALLTYLSRVLILSEPELIDLPRDTVIVEREVKDIIGRLMRSDAFRADPSSVLNETVPLPAIAILQREDKYNC